MTERVRSRSRAVEGLTARTEPWLSCDDCFEQTDVAVEAMMASEAPLGEAFRVHLRGCQACRDEARSLAELVAADHGLTPARAVARLDAALSRSDT